MPVLDSKIEHIKEYKLHGCNITGNLVMVRYYDAMKEDPQFGGFGSNIVYDYIDKAKEIVLAEFPEAVVKLSMPDLVCRI